LGCDHINALYKFTITYLLTYLLSVLDYHSLIRVVYDSFVGTLKPQSNGPLYSNTVIGTLAVDGWAVTLLNSLEFAGMCNRNSLYARPVCIARTMPSQDVCTSVRPSHASIASKRLHISSNFF